MLCGWRCLQKLEVLLQHMFDEADGELQDEDESYFEDLSVRSRSNEAGNDVVYGLPASNHAGDPFRLPDHAAERLVSDSSV